MSLKPLLRFYRYALAAENYLLLWRTMAAAWHVRRALRDIGRTREITPQFQAAIPVIPALYLPAQPGWRISDPQRIALFASFMITIPTRWGRCLQRSLIIWRLLNGYGVPAQLCIGVHRTDATDGHVWVSRLADHGRAFAEASDPHQTFLRIYSSPIPVKTEDRRQKTEDRSQKSEVRSQKSES
ncbi:MAG: lasso peptide biosynthesis B2 protein [Blastocatellia bacterium]